MMEEIDFEDEILIIHPEEDIRKFEADTNSNLELTIDPDEDIRIIESDINSNSKLSVHPDADIRKIKALETDTNPNLKLSIHPDEDVRKIKVITIDNNSNSEQASDTGEIDDDEEEEANDLEEGEIKDNTPVSKNRSDIACRFFKRGSCIFGSQCQYLHVSDTVYKMFDTNPQKKNDMPPVEHHSFPQPPIFPTPIVLPPRPFIEPPILVAPKADFPRQCDTFDDIWEKGLEQARILIRKKASLKNKNENSEPKKFDSKNNADKNKGQNFATADVGNELSFNKKYCEKSSVNSSSRKEKAYNEKESNFRYQAKSSDKWVDPWRRSKSPSSKKRPRSLSGSPPPRSRKHSSASTSTISSSSSEIDGIYRKPYNKSPRKRQRVKSRSRSVSPSRRPKRRNISPKRPFNGRRSLKSYSRSRSRSPHRKRTLSSRTESRSSSSSSLSSVCPKSPVFEDKNMKRISARLSEQFSLNKSPNRTTELPDSDCETSEMTVSSASCTPLSSDSEVQSPNLSPFLRNRQSQNRNSASSYSNKTTNPKAFSRNQSLENRNSASSYSNKTTNPKALRRNQSLENRNSASSYSNKTTDPKAFIRNESLGNRNSASSCSNKTTNPKAFSRNQSLENRNSASSYSNKTTNPKAFSRNESLENQKLMHLQEDVLSYQKEMQPSNNRKNPNNLNFKTEPSDCKPKNTASYFSSVNKPVSSPKFSEDKLSNEFGSKSKNLARSGQKPALAPKPAPPSKVPGNRLSRDMELLFMYQGLGNSKQNSSNVPKVKSSNPTSKTNRTDDAISAANKVNGNSESYGNRSKIDNASKNIVLNLQPKCKESFNPQDLNDGMVTVKRETVSKREKLLNKLKLIDDAIARKKGK